MCEVESFIDSGASAGHSKRASIFIVLFFYMIYSAFLAASHLIRGLESEKKENQQNKERLAMANRMKDTTDFLGNKMHFYTMLSILVHSNSPNAAGVIM